jgi:hypothetical protein
MQTASHKSFIDVSYSQEFPVCVDQPRNNAICLDFAIRPAMMQQIQFEQTRENYPDPIYFKVTGIAKIQIEIAESILK